MADIPAVSQEAVAPPVQPTNPELTRAGLADRLSTRTETLFADPLVRTLEPSYQMQEAAVRHIDPTKKLLATHDAKTSTSFLVESYPIEGSTEDKYVLIRWEHTNANTAEADLPNGWVRVVCEQGKEPRIALATSVGSAHQSLLPGGDYAEGWVTANEATELSQEALQDILARLNRSVPNAELTEKMWQYAERDRLRWHVGNANYLVSAAANRTNSQQYTQVAAYRDAAERQYNEFTAKCNLPTPERHEPTQAQIDEAIATYQRLVTYHPEIIEFARQRDEATLATWLRYQAGNIANRERASNKEKKDEKEQKRRADQAAIQAIKEELAVASTNS